MNRIVTIAAGLTLGLLVAAPAAAQDRHDHGQGDRHDQGMRGDRHDEGMRGDRHDMDRGRDWRGDRHDMDRGRHMRWRAHYNNGNHYGWRNHHRCVWTWRHHRRIRVC